MLAAAGVLGVNTLAAAPLAAFAGPKLELLKAFCYTRLAETKKDGKKLKLPGKGKLAAAQGGTENLIWMAHDVRSKRTILRIAEGDEEEDQDVELVPVVAPDPMVVAVPRLGDEADDPASEGGADRRTAAQLLADAPWLASIEGTFMGPASSSACTMRSGKDADAVARIIRSRLRSHVDLKMAVEAKKSHWVWRLMRLNIPRIAALIARSNHVVTDLDAISEEDSVLTMDLDAFVPIELASPAEDTGGNGKGAAGNKKAQGRARKRTSKAREAAAAGVVGTGGTLPPRLHAGAYLYFDQRLHKFVRSGKAARPFEERMAEHKKGASSSSTVSKFYGAYPTTTAVAAAKATGTEIAGIRKGVYEDLLPVVALGYRQEDAATVADVFYWGEGLESAVAGVNFRGAETLLAKKLHCVGYLAELAYGLLLAPAADVSVNPGFETCLGIFGGGD